MLNGFMMHAQGIETDWNVFISVESEAHLKKIVCNHKWHLVRVKMQCNNVSRTSLSRSASEK
jgi:hypothetical protein